MQYTKFRLLSTIFSIITIVVKILVPPTLTRLTVKKSNLKQNFAINVPESSLEEAKTCNC